MRCSDLNINTHCGSRLKWNVECFRCLFLIGPSRCINSNCPRMNRLCMMWSLPNPGNVTTCHIFPFKSFYEKSSPVSSVCLLQCTHLILWFQTQYKKMLWKNLYTPPVLFSFSFRNTGLFLKEEKKILTCSHSLFCQQFQGLNVSLLKKETKCQMSDWIIKNIKKKQKKTLDWWFALFL